MTEQRYTEVEPTWVAHQWDDSLGDVQAFLINWTENSGLEVEVYVGVAHMLKLYYRVKVANFPTFASFEISLGDYILYSPELNQLKVVTDDQFHRAYTAKL